MKIFQRVQTSLASLGHRRNESPFNKTQLRVMVIVVLNLFSICAYIAREPHTVKQYLDSIYMSAVAVLITIARVCILYKNATIFDFIDTVEETVNRSELNSY